MYIEVPYPRFRVLTKGSPQRPAAGFLVWSFVAGTTTATPTYSNRGLTIPNTNPVVLDANGEADIFVGTATKLIVTEPGATISTPYYTEFDYIGEQQGTPPLLTTTIAGTVDNNYAVNIVPAVTSLYNGMTIIMTPDVTNTSTLASHSFTGTGINDITWGGAYVGTTPGSVFTIEVTSANVDPPAAPTAVASAAAGVVTAGNHRIKITLVTADGESLPGLASGIVVGDGAHQIDLSTIPVGVAGKGVTDRHIWMTKAGGTTYYYVTNLGDNVTTTASINIADAALTVVAPTTNTTGSGTGADVVRWKKDILGWVTGVAITGTTQPLIEEVTYAFANRSGHSIGDVWALTVATPPTISLCGLAAKRIRKNVASSLNIIDAGDMVVGIPTVHVFSTSGDCWVLVNPSLPVLSTQIPQRIRVNISGAYVATIADQGKELNFLTSSTLTLPACGDVANTFYYVTNSGGGIVTINVAGGTDLIYPAGDLVGVTSFSLGPDTIQLSTNGADWHQLTTGAQIPVGTIALYPNPLYIAAPTAALGAAGVVTAGDHNVYLSAITTYGEVLGSYTTVSVTAANERINLTNIPTPLGHISAYKIYMTKTGPGATLYYIATASGSTYTINLADGSLTDAAPTFSSDFLPPPSGFFYTNGAAHSRTVYSRLFSLLDCIWGVGDGSTTFNVPNFAIDPGAVGGSPSSTLTIIKY